ncbi:TauD/TfdA family dioxygenase [Streptomyces sp. NPDC001939]
MDRSTFSPEAWTYTLSREQTVEVGDALTVAQNRLTGRDMLTDRAITRRDFPLGHVGSILEAISAEVSDGRGFAILRGLPVDQFDERQNALLLRGLATYLGPASPAWTAELYRPFHFHMAGGNVPGLPPTFISPVFSLHRGRFSTRYVRHTLLETPTVTQVPLPQGAMAAFDLLEELADENSVDMELRAGDLQLVNNHVALHSRTAYRDPQPPAQPRHLLRSWVTFPHYRGRRAGEADEYLRFGWLTDDQQGQLASSWSPPTAPDRAPAA